MTTRIIISLDIPDSEYSVEDILPEWPEGPPPTADDVLAEMKRSVHIHRMLSEWGLDSATDHVFIQVNTSDDNDHRHRVEHSIADWNQTDRGHVA